MQNPLQTSNALFCKKKNSNTQSDLFAIGWQIEHYSNQGNSKSLRLNRLSLQKNLVKFPFVYSFAPLLSQHSSLSHSAFFIYSFVTIFNSKTSKAFRSLLSSFASISFVLTSNANILE